MTDLTALVIDDATLEAVTGVALRRDMHATATLDLTEASLLEADPAAERARLRSRGLIRARIVSWQHLHTSLSVTLYELADAGQARLAVHDVTEALRAAGARMGLVDGLAGAAITEDGHDLFVVTCSVGPFHVVVVLAGGPATMAGAVARAQEGRLDESPAARRPTGGL